MQWILIFWLYAGNGAVPGTATFEDKQACENALKAVQESVSSSNFRKGICVPSRS